MKIRVTLMTENEEHLDDPNISDEELNNIVKKGWEYMSNLIASQYGNVGDRCFVEKIDIIEK